MKTKVIKENETLENERKEVLENIAPESEESEEKAPFIEPVMLFTNRTYRANGEKITAEEGAERIGVKDFLVPPARVGVELTQTVNMGNYESIRISISMQAPCYTEELDGAYEHLVEKVKQRLVVERDEAAEWAKKARGTKNVF